MSTNLVIPVEGSHFYLPEGAPLYEVPNKSKPGEYRRATIRDAKAAQAWPSVTTVNNVLDKPALTAWKINNAILSALTLPRNDGESIDDFARRVAEDADRPSSDAADLGTTVHNALDAWFAPDSKREVPDALAGFINPVDAWIKAANITIRETERICVTHHHKYGCRVDALGDDGRGHAVIIDWKTQKSRNGKLSAYDDHCAQLAANAQAATQYDTDSHVSTSRPVRLINVYISTTDKDANGNAQIMVHEWHRDEIEEAWELFLLCRRIYKIRNGI